MREIKFRAWNERRKELSYCHDLYWFEENFIRQNGDEDTIIEQYTGLHDSKGREIYEGDILTNFARGSFPFAVEWENGGADLYVWHGYSFDDEHYTIIGNIHENPEPLSEVSNG